MLTEQDYKNGALEYVRDFYDETDLFAMSPVTDESASDAQDVLVVVKANNCKYEVILSDVGEVLNCEQKL